MANYIYYLHQWKRSDHSNRCQRCQGKGKLPKYWKRGGVFVEVLYKCPDCGGTGQKPNNAS
jgi:DnaJ-class molecular chaperone